MANINSAQMNDALAWATGNEHKEHEPSSNPFVWFWEAVEGDFNEDRSTSQIMMDAAVSMIPLVDQLCDVRDLIANCRKLHRDITDPVAWVGLALTLIGLFPTLGSLVKGVLKIFFAFIRRTGGQETAEAVEAAMTWVIKFLRRRDVQKYLAKYKVDEVFKWLSTQIKSLRSKLDVRQMMVAFDRAIKVLEGMVAKVSYLPSISNKAKQTLQLVKQIRMKADSGLDGALKPARDMIDTILLRLEKEIMVKQRGIVDVRNIHYRGVIPETTAVSMMQSVKPKWLTQSGTAIFPGLSPAKTRQLMQRHTATRLPDGSRRNHKEVFPDLTNQNIESFHTLAAATVKGPARMYRILSPNSKAMGDCWVSEEVFNKLQNSPDPKAAWRKFLAVWPDWNVDGQFVIYDIKAGESINVWRGIASSQTKSSLPGAQLEGGYEQIIIKLSKGDKRNESLMWYPNPVGTSGNLGNPFTQEQVDVMMKGMDKNQRDQFFQTHMSMRNKIEHPNISGPFDTGWGYEDFGGSGMSGRIGLPALDGQVTTVGK
jgi:hypothetical protein